MLHPKRRFNSSRKLRVGAAHNSNGPSIKRRPKGKRFTSSSSSSSSFVSFSCLPFFLSSPTCPTPTNLHAPQRRGERSGNHFPIGRRPFLDSGANIPGKLPQGVFLCTLYKLHSRCFFGFLFGYFPLSISSFSFSLFLFLPLFI